MGLSFLISKFEVIEIWQQPYYLQLSPVLCILHFSPSNSFIYNFVYVISFSFSINSIMARFTITGVSDLMQFNIYGF